MPSTHRLPSGGTATYLRRSDWGAGPLTRGHAVDPARFVGLVSHHDTSGRPPAGELAPAAAHMRQLTRARPDLGPEVPYSWVIFPGAGELDAILGEGRGKGRTGAHTAGLNSTRYGIAWAGNTNTDPVTAGMVEAFRWLGATQLAAPATAVATIGHRDYDATECPGNIGYAQLARLQPPFVVDEPPGPPPDPEYLRLGMVHPAVERWCRDLSTLLDLLDNSPHIPILQAFTPDVDNLTRRFQNWAGIAVDGVVGPESRSTMLAKLNEHAVKHAQRAHGYRPAGPGAWELER